MSVQLPPCPASLKAIQHYLKTATEHDSRDPVVSYWCRLYALQMGLKIDRKSSEATALLTALMDWLETQKKVMADNEAISHELAAQAHIENYALKLFLYADSQDRAANFGKNVVKAFYTSGMLFDVLTTFGELPEELIQNRKYAKWKAAYIHNCLKNGETPVPGPMIGEGEFDDNEEGDPEPGSSGFGAPAMGFVQPQDDSNGFGSSTQPTPNTYVPPTTPSRTPTSQPEYPGGFVPYNPPTFPTTPTDVGPSIVANTGGNGGTIPQGGVMLKPEQISKAQKYCKWAGSALNYDDIPTAITNLQKALTLLQTGRDS